MTLSATGSIRCLWPGVVGNARRRWCERRVSLGPNDCRSAVVGLLSIASAADLTPLLPRRDRKRADEIHAGILRWFEQSGGDELTAYAYPDRPTWATRR